jgi:MFS transporter, DHA1 family, multidrug resistance protein
MRAGSGFHPVRTWRENGAVATIAFSAGMASLAMNFWFPFLPLYMIALGAVSDVDALFWVGVATTGQGFARLVSGPFWGVISDRFGRKLMYVRALFFATATTAIAAVATEPWHVAVAFACQGFFSGFIPAAVALTSVTVPDRKLSGALGMVAAAQYLGNTIGPAAGAGLALMFGLRGAIVAGALMPAASALLVLLTVPRDRVVSDPNDAPALKAGEAPAVRPPLSSVFSVQFGIAVFLYFFLFATSQLVRLATPIAVKERLSEGNVEGVVGIAFTLAGVGSVIGVVVIARRWVRPGRFVVMLVMGTLSVGVSHVLLALSPSVTLFVAVFMVISMLQAAMIPATNTLIASGVPRERRGTAFGIASSAQALAFMVGPMSAAAMAAISLFAGFALVGVLFLVVGVLLWALLREPPLSAGVEEKVAEARA